MWYNNKESKQYFYYSLKRIRLDKIEDSNHSATKRGTIKIKIKY
jgi:hypothetical protein